MQYTKLTHVLAITGFAIALTAMGCGDDDGDTPVAGTGGMSGAGGAAGTMMGGTGGAKAGTGGTGGAAPTMAECVTKTSAILTPARMACTNCVCTKGLAVATACANTTQCWPLISCVGASGCAPADQTCIATMCSMFIGDQPSIAAATAFGTPVVRGMCSAECVASDPDAGADDAGL